jgi:hypothetical protein
MAVKFLRGKSGAAFHGDIGVGIGGVADHQHLDVAAEATALRALPWVVKI